MPTLSASAIASLLESYVGANQVPSIIYDQLHTYLELIFKWNSRINLTAIRDPEEIVRRHFGESLFAGLHLNSASASSPKSIVCDSLLDLGSGAGFPGIPIQLLYPALPVTLAESRTRKAAFLQEVTRALNLKTAVWSSRAESMPPERRFHTVTLRAVDAMDTAVEEATYRADRQVLILGTQQAAYQILAQGFACQTIPLPDSRDGVLWIAKRTARIIK